MRPQRKAGENLVNYARTLNNLECFNEAPAQSWGKRKICSEATHLVMVASMRPQRKAGENQERVIRAKVGTSASMRPQRKAGENTEFSCAKEIAFSVLQ